MNPKKQCKMASSNLRTLKAFPFEAPLQPAGSFTYLLKQMIPMYSLSGSTGPEVSSLILMEQKSGK